MRRSPARGTPSRSRRGPRQAPIRTYDITDAGAAITPGEGCTSVNAHEVECSAVSWATVGAKLGDMNDSFSVAGLDWTQRSEFDWVVEADGGEGNDTLQGSPSGDRFFGGPGNDEISGGRAQDAACEGPTDFGCTFNYLYGGPGVDQLFGGEDGDYLVGGADADDLSGGGDRDYASYRDQAGPVVVSVDGIADDGEAGEGDNVREDVEAVYGTRHGGDTLIGNTFRNLFWGGGGDDRLLGRAGNDYLDGGAQDDEIRGGRGIDSILGRRGNDVIRGGPKGDHLYGNPGNDVIWARDGNRDKISGGYDSDRAQVNASDVVKSVERFF
jgi:Ca2+-binding RTX toxin-like protein